MRAMKFGMIVLLLTCLGASATAETYVFTAPTGAWYDWNDETNWIPEGVPGASDNATIGGAKRAVVTDSRAVNYAYVAFTNNSSTDSVGYLRLSADTSQLNVNSNLYLAWAGGSTGYILQEDGTLTTNNLYMKTTQGSGEATYYLQGGTLNVTNVAYVGESGRGVFEHSGGTNNSSKIMIGRTNYASYGADTDVAYYNLTGGTLNVSTYIYLGNKVDARGHLKMGDETGATGQITGSGNMIIKRGDNANGMGIVQGFGNVNLTGSLENNGKVIADGWGGVNTSDRTLSMANFSSFVTDEAKQVAGAGWYAQNRGKLILPSLSIAGGSSTAYFGEDTAGSQNLINSMKLDFDGVTGGDLSIALLAADNSEADGIPGDIIGVWDIDGSAFTFGGGDVDLRVKYDEALATTLGLVEANLKFYHQIGGSWVDVTTSVDTANNLITADGVDSFSKFAVGVVPEPATLSLIGIGAFLVLAKRRKK